MTPNDELLTVSAVARRLGIAPSTLRTWDRRYGLGPSTHEVGNHRKYSPLDLAKLMVMRRLISRGVSPCDAADTAKNFDGRSESELIFHEIADAQEIVSRLYKSAKKLDMTFVESELRQYISKNGVVSTWSQVIAPLLFLIGKDWETTGKGVDVEHLLSEKLITILREPLELKMKPLNAQPVLLASIGEELHCLALHALAAALAERRIECHFLGARTPLDAISAMVTRTAPPAVFLWAQLKKNANPDFFRDLPAVRPSPRIVIGGPGWNLNECADVAVATDLSQACQEIERAVGL
jgi:DNA-binding transcriptional MerR regulator